jgi:GH24 family phage-related lysozyme (muramidase)
MKIKKIVKARKKEEFQYPLPYNFNSSTNPIILEILGNKNWYLRYLTSQSAKYDLYQEAGLKENVLGGLLSAIILMLSGYKISDASVATDIPEPDIMLAMQDKSQVDYARNIMNKMKGDIFSRPSTENLDTFLEEAFKYIGANEGLKLKPYNDTKGIPTIGVGHKILPNENFFNGISEEEAKQLFSNDVQNKLNTCRNIFPLFDSYPNYVKVALLDGVYRGDHKKEYKTTKLINNGDWINAAKEYLRNNDYYASQKQGTGIAKRMKNNAKRMEQYGKETQKNNFENI